MTKIEQYSGKLPVARSGRSGTGMKEENKQYENPDCFNPEKDNPYPLCIGKGMEECVTCALWADLPNQYDESIESMEIDAGISLRDESTYYSKDREAYCEKDSQRNYLLSI